MTIDTDYKMSNILINQCFDTIDLLATGAKSLRLEDIVERLDLPKSAVRRFLSVLCLIGWLEQDSQTGLYRLTLRLAVLGQRLLSATKPPDICQFIVNRLAQDSQELVRVATVQEDGLAWIAYAQGAKAGLIYEPETTAEVPLQVTADGKAWLATLTTGAAVKVVLKNGFGHPDSQGPNAVRTIDAILSELEVTREQGWALAVEEAEPGVISIAAAIRPNGGSPVGTVSVAGPSLRFGGERILEISRLISIAADDLAALWPLRRTPPAKLSITHIVDLGR
ncbi:MAG: IclR family transcriptional regulator [Mesorhizobium sp.]|uniref:IclR family transcriptional regulator n=1 Tax=Mesorhizobium sp. TaxID=1871066 RepID=UPI000FEA3A26|nr:IclR family transcriptional regulator [Mesorhizobium sp.]RWI34655.1 MAG: IclR family transcriptional regulator [Mesorhizobium sp.]RWI62805.1 MAG: IclR family transcriptional regulator [Mesorhizobium sp.]RWI81367.1 MAG: IclR family transcriptional regulator [Mesorhizobium sp.]RWJ42125.1 MAG: IclR family transcriptional regulator [Mesorhizobium sp.]RWJ56982.1 MAG: IclR family transcriptional regulator [Mesorhizobium sp.]